MSCRDGIDNYYDVRYSSSFLLYNILNIFLCLQEKVTWKRTICSLIKNIEWQFRHKLRDIEAPVKLKFKTSLLNSCITFIHLKNLFVVRNFIFIVLDNFINHFSFHIYISREYFLKLYAGFTNGRWWLRYNNFWNIR